MISASFTTLPSCAKGCRYAFRPSLNTRRGQGLDIGALERSVNEPHSVIGVNTVYDLITRKAFESTHPKFVQGQSCANISLFTSQEDEDNIPESGSGGGSYVSSSSRRYRCSTRKPLHCGRVRSYFNAHLGQSLPHRSYTNDP